MKTWHISMEIVGWCGKGIPILGMLCRPDHASQAYLTQLDRSELVSCALGHRSDALNSRG